jgi:mono/diheme cytochrome c family protein
MLRGILKISVLFLFFLSVSPLSAYDKNPPFKLTKLQPVMYQSEGNAVKAYNPTRNYRIFINYELGMHCVGFDMSYCCVIPPYNSIQAQAIETGIDGGLPSLITSDNNKKLYYFVKDNSYSQGNKMDYWGVSRDVFGDGHMDRPGDNVPDYVWDHLFIYTDLAGTIPPHATKKDRKYVGRDLPIPIDSGPTGQHLAGGYLVYSGRHGGDIVMTDSLVPAVKNVKLILTSSYLWDALGLPLTAFNDSTRKGSIRSVTQRDFNPFQKSVVQLQDQNGRPIMDHGRIVQYFGTNPVDIPNCYACHSREGKAAVMARESGLKYSDEEYNYWKKSYPDESTYMARLSEASINILELHDKLDGTHFLKYYDPNAASKRLGPVGEVNCADCHGDNISGNLQEPRPTATGYKVVHAMPLTKAIHKFHLGMVPMPDGAGRTQSCQACHPTHFSNRSMNDDTNPLRVTTRYGKARFDKEDVRTTVAGCYVRRDAHSNPDVKPPFFLNAVGKYLYVNVSMKDQNGKPVKVLRGLYCTNCHTDIAQMLYKTDNITDAVTQAGKTLRNKSLKDIVAHLTGGSMKKFNALIDPKTYGVNEVRKYYSDHKSAILVKNVGKDSKLDLKPWYHKGGQAVPYSAVSGGSDWWLSPSEPHCADCHIAPFVESEGGKYFPIDQPHKYSLYRYSKAHGDIACQSCHESTHGLYPTRYEGPNRTVDITTHEQALQYSPDGKYTGPVTCAACHTVNKKGVPVQLRGTKYANDYWAAVTLIHFMRSGDQKLSIHALVQKFPYKKSSHIVVKGWK